MQIDGRVPDPTDNNDTEDIYTWQANVPPIPSPYACCYKVSITLRVMRINDTLDKEFMTFLLPLFSDLIISLGKGDPFRKIDQQFLLVFFSAVRELSGKRPCFRYLRVKNARARNHESSSRIDCSRIERKKYFFFILRRSNNGDVWNNDFDLILPFFFPFLLPLFFQVCLSNNLE